MKTKKGLGAFILGIGYICLIFGVSLACSDFVKLPTEKLIWYQPFEILGISIVLFISGFVAGKNWNE